MKKIFVILLIVFCSFSLVCCGGNNGDNSVGLQSSVGSHSGSNTGTGSSHSGQGSAALQGGTVDKQGSVCVLNSGGGMECAFVSWVPQENAGYTVYEKGAGKDYERVDNELIRRYSDYFRVDIPGLYAGEHEIKIVPCINSVEDEASSTIVKVETTAHAREGFAFSAVSPNKTASGSYNDDGSLKADAQVLYITKDNINTVKLNVIKDKNGRMQEAVGLLEILYLRGKGYDKTPLDLRFIGTITASDIQWVTENVAQDEFNYVALKGCYNLTAEGIGDDATCYEWSFKVRDANNVEIRNFGFMLFKDDGVTIDTDNYNIWVHNNDFFYGSPGSDADQVKGDGSCDNKKSDYLTISYNHYWDSGKVNLCGLGDSGEFFVTYHHNWFDHSDSRHPRIRFGSVHVYNNYYDGVAKYGIGATMGCSCFAESNYFLNSKKPILSSRQGTDAKGDGTFSGEDGGIVKAYGNVYQSTDKPIDYSANNLSFDCYTVTDKNFKIPADVKTLQGGTVYNNFDTSDTMYSYAPDNAESVPAIVKNYAGRFCGGDFKFTFGAADNSSYVINQSLKNALTAYKSSLVSVGGI